MKVKFNQSRQVGGVIYGKGISNVPDAFAEDNYFKVMEQAGDVVIIPDPKTPEELKAKADADAKAKTDADAKLRAEVKAEILADMEADKKNSSQSQKKS